jgi:bacterioferritin
MKAKEGIVDLLNSVLTLELTAINQYFLAAKMCENWGYPRLHDKYRDLSIGEMKDSEEIVEHILYLEGLPNLQRLNAVPVGENAHETLQLGLRAEQNAVTVLADGIRHCDRVGDFTTKVKLERMIQDEEEHVDWFETQLATIEQIGLQNYLAQQIREG